MKFFKKKKTGVAVFSRKEKLLILPRNRTAAGVYIAGEPILTAPIDINPEDLGILVYRSLNATEDGVPHPEPDEWRLIGKPLLEAAGVRSWASFMKKTVDCEIYREGLSLEVVPMRNMGAKEGFRPINDAKRTLAADSPPGTLGEAIRKAMDLAALAIDET